MYTVPHKDIKNEPLLNLNIMLTIMMIKNMKKASLLYIKLSKNIIIFFVT